MSRRHARLPGQGIPHPQVRRRWAFTMEGLALQSGTSVHQCWRRDRCCWECLRFVRPLAAAARHGLRICDSKVHTEWHSVMDSVFPRATRTYVPFGLAVSPSGNVYVTGTTAAMQRDADEVLTIKYDTDGNLLWSRTESGLSLVVGFTGISAISRIALDGQENVFVASNEESIGFFDAAVWKYDKDGHTVPGGFGLPGHIDVLQVDRQGNTYILGGVIPDNPNGSAFSL